MMCQNELGNEHAECCPIFFVGVPRSGTTLVRMMLDSHPEVMCGPEAPWIAGRDSGDATNLRDLTTWLLEAKWGPVSGFSGVTSDVVHKSIGAAIDGIMSAAAREQGKKRWAEKTPENILAVPFLYRVFPDAKFVHVVRDGRDVALSTSKAAWKRIPLAGQRVRNTYHNALRRWVVWIDRFLDDADHLGLTFHTLGYEDLVRDPPAQLRELLRFLGLPWSDRVLHPYDAKHDVIDPKGQGVASFYQRQEIDSKALDRWRTELSARQRATTEKVAEDMLRRLGYAPTADRT